MSKNLQKFVWKFKNSLTNPNFYKGLKKENFKQVFRYLFVLLYFILLFKVLVLGSLIISQSAKISQFVGEFTPQAMKIYPDGLEVNIQDDQIAVNKKSPLYIDFPKNLTQKEFSYFVIFDMKSELDTSIQNSSLIYINSKQVFFNNIQSKNDKYEFNAKDFEEPIKITKLSYREFISEINTFLNYFYENRFGLILSGIVLIPVIGALFQVVWLAIYLMFPVMILTIVASFFKLKVGFSEVYKMSVYGLTVPIIFTIFMSALGLNYPMIFTSSFLLWMVFVFSKMEVSG